MNYDDAKVVERHDDEFEEGKYGKSYDEIRREQEELTNRSRAGVSERDKDEQRTAHPEDDTPSEKHHSEEDKRRNEHEDQSSEDTTGYEGEANIDRPGDNQPPR